MKLVEPVFWSAVTAFMAALPTIGSGLFGSVGDILDPAPAKLVKAQPVYAYEPGLERVDGAPQITFADRKRSGELFIYGLRQFQAANYEEAKVLWKKAYKLNPYNSDLKEGLRRVKILTGSD